MRFLFVTLLCMMPFATHAAVIISEIAWMGTTVSPNDEWIELYNTGGNSVSVDGWTLKDGAALSIPLAGSIGAGEYALLERTDDTTVAGTALVIYTGALSNAGSVLSLVRNDGSIEDQVAGGVNWESVGGDNVSKETAQKSSSGWKTAVPTPKQGFSGVIIEDEDEEEIEEEEEDTEEDPVTPVTQKSSGSGENITIEMQVPDVTLALSLVAPEVVYVNQKIELAAVPKGLGKTILESLVFEWNFGDFATGAGREVGHAYSHAGEYAVTLKGAFGRHEQVVRKTITVLPVSFSLSINDKGRVLIHNNAKYEVNISGFTLKANEKFIFPERSIILPNSTIVLPKNVAQDEQLHPVLLYDQKGAFLASTAHAKISNNIVSIPILSVVPAELVVAQSESISNSETLVHEEDRNFSFGSEVAIGSATKTKEQVGTSTQIASLVSLETESLPQNVLPLLGLLGIVTLGLIAVFYTGSRRKES